jgi:hypothetical protein
MASRFTRLLLWAAAAALTLAALAVRLPGAQGVQAQEGVEALKVRVETTDSGFRCAAGTSAACIGEREGDFIIQIEQGRLVELTFVWAHQGYVLDEHIIVLEGYKLESDEINAEHRETTLKFIADKPGKFGFKCDLECEVHDFLQRATLLVTRGGGGAAAPAFTPTKLEVTPSTWATAGDPVSLVVSLRDVAGNPVPKAEVELSLAAEFAGTQGRMQLGHVKTDANGVGFFEYRPTVPMDKHAITARFDGAGVFDGSEHKLVIEEAAAPPPAFEMEPVGLEGFRAGAPAVFGGAAIAIWAVFGFVVYQAVSMAWTKKSKQHQ